MINIYDTKNNFFQNAIQEEIDKQLRIEEQKEIQMNNFLEQNKSQSHITEEKLKKGDWGAFKNKLTIEFQSLFHLSVDKLIKSFEFEFDIPSDTLIVYYSKNEYEEVLTPDKEIEIIKLKHIFQKQW